VRLVCHMSFQFQMRAANENVKYSFYGVADTTNKKKQNKRQYDYRTSRLSNDGHAMFVTKIAKDIWKVKRAKHTAPLQEKQNSKCSRALSLSHPPAVNGRG